MSTKIRSEVHRAVSASQRYADADIVSQTRSDSEAVLTEDQCLEIDARVAAHRNRVDREMQQLGIRRELGDTLRTCSLCNRETVRTPREFFKRGWQEVDGQWLCPLCAGSDYVPEDLGISPQRRLQPYQPLLDVLGDADLSREALVRKMAGLGWESCATVEALTLLRDMCILEYSRDEGCWRKVRK